MRAHGKAVVPWLNLWLCSVISHTPLSLRLEDSHNRGHGYLPSLQIKHHGAILTRHRHRFVSEALNQSVALVDVIHIRVAEELDSVVFWQELHTFQA